MGGVLIEAIALIRFLDADVRMGTLVSVRVGGGLVELRYVLDAGEVDVVMMPANCQRRLDALDVALATAREADT